MIQYLGHPEVSPLSTLTQPEVPGAGQPSLRQSLTSLGRRRLTVGTILHGKRQRPPASVMMNLSHGMLLFPGA